MLPPNGGKSIQFRPIHSTEASRAVGKKTGTKNCHPSRKKDDLKDATDRAGGRPVGKDEGDEDRGGKSGSESNDGVVGGKIRRRGL